MGKQDEIVPLEHNVFMAVDRSAPQHGDRAMYCEVEKLPDGALLVRACGELIEGECYGTQASIKA